MAPDVIVIRHVQAGSAALLAKHTKAAIINAVDGVHKHPTRKSAPIANRIRTGRDRSKCGSRVWRGGSPRQNPEASSSFTAFANRESRNHCAVCSLLSTRAIRPEMVAKECSHLSGGPRLTAPSTTWSAFQNKWYPRQHQPRQT
ncbi:MAG: hypothetical protein SF187_28140 [Deltaproteobacteria bacterium]|nr:hypothetical protein [Deltaproteobacteria bacterium]